MNPGSLAFWGASNNPMKMGTIQLANVVETGYEGGIYPIHPTEKTVMGLPAHRSIGDLGKPVDLAQLTLPTEVVPGILDECGRAGIRRAVVISGGFKEVAGDRGRQLEREIIEIARKHEMRFLGPNCVGIYNSLCDLNTTTIHSPPGGGRIAFASQSGAYTAMINPYLRAQGIRMCQTISVGNEADMDLTDCVQYLAQEPEVAAIGLYVEAVRRPREFAAAVRQAVRMKPVVAIYVGGTEAGSRSSLSHTGALSGPDEVYDGLFRQAGVIRARDIDQMFDMLRALSSQPLPAGGRMAIITNSGGPGSSLAYHVEKAGLTVPRFSDTLAARLDEVTGSLAYVRNPIDLTFETDMLIFTRLLELVFDSGEVDGAFLYGIFGGPDFMVNMVKRFPELEKLKEVIGPAHEQFLGGLAGVPRNYGKPLIVMSFLGPDSASIGPLVDGDVPVFPSASRAALAMSALLDYRRIRASA